VACLELGFPQLPCSSLAYPFLGYLAVGETGLLMSFLPVQLLPLQALSGVISSSMGKGKTPFGSLGMPAVSKNESQSLWGWVWCFFHFAPFLMFQRFPWCNPYLSCTWWICKRPKMENLITLGLRENITNNA
jgi:hypothetical protein